MDDANDKKSEFKQKVAAFTAAKRKAKNLKIELDDVKAEALALGNELMEYMIDAGLQNFTGSDGSTCYIRREFTVGVDEGHMPLMCEDLREAGLMEVLSVNSQTLKSLVKEDIKAAAEIKGLKYDALSEEEATALLPDYFKQHVHLGTKITAEARGL